MNVATVHSAVMRMTLMAPITAAPPNTRPGVTMFPLLLLLPDALPSWPNRSLTVEKTPSALRIRYRIPIATIQMNNSAIESTSEILNADQMSTCRSCSLARRGPRPAALPWPLPGAGRPVGREAVAVAAPAPDSPPGTDAPPAGGTGAVAGGGAAGGAARA